MWGWKARRFEIHWITIFKKLSFVDCGCDVWTEWQGKCSQQCGGCGKRQRKRVCIKVRSYTYVVLVWLLIIANKNIKDETCQTVEKRPCNFDACPEGTNFLLNNGEVHLLWRGCCIGKEFLDYSCALENSHLIGLFSIIEQIIYIFSGLFRQGDSCAALETNSNPLLSIISELLKTHDAYGPQISEPPLEGAAIRNRKRL